MLKVEGVREDRCFWHNPHRIGSIVRHVLGQWLPRDDKNEYWSPMYNQSYDKHVHDQKYKIYFYDFQDLHHNKVLPRKRQNGR